MLARLEGHLKRRGYGSWVTVGTSEKGSYRVADVMRFLELHLPRSKMWRCMFADDLASHMVPEVRNLCWERGYVFIPRRGYHACYPDA